MSFPESKSGDPHRPWASVCLACLGKTEKRPMWLERGEEERGWKLGQGGGRAQTSSRCTPTLGETVDSGIRVLCRPTQWKSTVTATPLPPCYKATGKFRRPSHFGFTRGSTPVTAVGPTPSSCKKTRGRALRINAGDRAGCLPRVDSFRFGILTTRCSGQQVKLQVVVH